MATSSTLLTSKTPLVGGQKCDLTMTIAKLNFNETHYLSLEIKYNHFLPLESSCEYSTELTIQGRKFILKHYRFKNDRLYLPTFMKWEDVEDLLAGEKSLQCTARVIGYKRFESSERFFGDRSYHGSESLKDVTTVDLTLTVGRFKILMNKDYLISMSSFFRQILQNADRHSRHDDLMLTELRDEAFVTLIDICHHKFWCNYELKDDLLELAKLYQFPFVVEFHKQFFASTTPEKETTPVDIDHKFSLQKVLENDISNILT